MNTPDALVLHHALELAKGERKTGNIHVLTKLSGSIKNAILVVHSGELVGCNYLGKVGKEAIGVLLQAVAFKAFFVRHAVSDFSPQSGIPSLEDILRELHIAQPTDKQPRRSDYLPADKVIRHKLDLNVGAAPSLMGDEVKKILVVDDSPLSRKVIINVFAGKGYDITQAVDGLDALDKLYGMTPDLLLLDLILPKMDGYQVLNAMKKNDTLKKIPVIMLTARDALMDKLKGKMSAADEYLTKPVNPKELMSKVQKYLR